MVGMCWVSEAVRSQGGGCLVGNWIYVLHSGETERWAGDLGVGSTEEVTEATTRELVQLPQSSEGEEQGPLEVLGREQRRCRGTEYPKGHHFVTGPALWDRESCPEAIFVQGGGRLCGPMALRPWTFRDPCGSQSPLVSLGLQAAYYLLENQYVRGRRQGQHSDFLCISSDAGPPKNLFHLRPLSRGPCPRWLCLEPMWLARGSSLLSDLPGRADAAFASVTTHGALESSGECGCLGSPASKQGLNCRSFSLF